jgi:hypothetical protein
MHYACRITVKFQEIFVFAKTFATFFVFREIFTKISPFLRDFRISRRLKNAFSFQPYIGYSQYKSSALLYL